MTVSKAGRDREGKTNNRKGRAEEAHVAQIVHVKFPFIGKTNNSTFKNWVLVGHPKTHIILIVGIIDAVVPAINL
jgi:hypothetical protein